MPSDEYYIKPFTLDTWPLMQQLFRSAFHMEISKQAFLKKFDTAVFGSEVIGYLAIHAPTGEPAAFYGVFPVRVLVQGKEILAAQSGDTMTHPAHQKKGLFMRLARQTYATCEEKGIELIFGQPNRNSHHGLIKLGWKNIDNIIYYDLKLKVKTVPLAYLFNKLGSHRQYLYFARKLLAPYRINVSDFTNSYACGYGRVLRNKNYLSYKKSSDKLFIKIEEAVFWIRLTDVLWIGDVNNVEKITPKVLKRLKRLAFVLGLNTIRFHLNETVELPSFLRTFRRSHTEASCFYYFSNDYAGSNLLLTGADFDTW